MTVDFNYVIINCISHINDVVFRLLYIYGVIRCLLKMLEIGYATDATNLISIINTGLAQSYVFISQQPYVSRPLKLAVRLVRSCRTYLDQQPYVSRSLKPASPFIRSSCTYLDQQPYVSPSRRTYLDQLPYVSRLLKPASCLVRNSVPILISNRMSRLATERLAQKPHVSFSSRSFRSAGRK